MPPFTVNPHRLDPYKRFKFRVVWDGRPVAGITQVSALRRTTEAVRHRSGADPNHELRAPGRTTFAPLVLRRGVTHDTDFEAWAELAWRAGAGAGGEVALRDLRKEVRVELLNEAGQAVLAYVVHRCWPSAYEPLPDLDAADPAVAIETLVLEHEGWERDRAVQEPAEPAAGKG